MLGHDLIICFGPAEMRILLVKIPRFVTSSNQENKEILVIRLDAQLPAKIDAALARQVPIQNQKREAVVRKLHFRLFSTADCNYLVTPAFNQPLQNSSAFWMVFGASSTGRGERLPDEAA